MNDINKISFEDKRLFRQTNMQANLYSDRAIRDGKWDNTIKNKPMSINDTLGLQQMFICILCQQRRIFQLHNFLVI